jgi:glycosyltransferase involved in cell wall biosynthesis
VSGSGVVDAHPARPADGGVRLRQRQSEPPGVAARVSCDLVAIGPWLPFIVGQSIATAALVRHLERGGIRSGQSIRNLSGKWAQHLSRVPRYVWAFFALAAARKAPWVYISVDAGIGVYVNILCSALAQLRGSRVIAHHHNYSYIAQPSGRIALFCRAAGANAVHITLCELMSRELRERYGGVRHTLELSNTYTVGADRGPKTAFPERFTLGHLSNLSTDKGLPAVISCLRLLQAAGVDAVLRLAGPAADRDAAAIIEAALVEFAGSLIYEGPLYGSADQKRGAGPRPPRGAGVRDTRCRVREMLHFWRHGSDGRAGGAGRRVLRKNGFAAAAGVGERSGGPGARFSRVASSVQELQRQGEEHLHNLFAVLNCDA